MPQPEVPLGRSPILGVIADDFTGATDVASMLVRGGLRTSLVIGVPSAEASPDVDAVVVALKSRTAPVAQAVSESLAALDWLRSAGVRQIYFKVCSTFDSTPQGNIGPVADALGQGMGAAITPICPALPENGRTVYMGRLFVGTQLLSESSMRHHPLTPMIESDLVKVMAAQTKHRVGLVRHVDVAAGPDALRLALAARREEGCTYAVVDAVTATDLATLANTVCTLPLVVAGSGLALSLPAAYAAQGWIRTDSHSAQLGPIGPGALVLAGSCSAATNAQVAAWKKDGGAAWRVDARALAAGEPVIEQVVQWASACIENEPVLVYASAPPEEVDAIQREIGVERAGALVEQCLAGIAARLVDAGVERLVVAGGETSGAVVRELGVQRLRIGPAIAPGVPWTAVQGRPLHLALKSGNFGGPDFFRQALALSP